MDFATVDVVHAEDEALSQALDHAALDGEAPQRAAGAGPDTRMIRVEGGVVAIGSTEHAAGSAVVALDLTVVAAIDRVLGRVMEVDGAGVAAGGSASRHVIAKEPASVDGIAALVAFAAAAARAPVAAVAVLVHASRKDGGAEYEHDGDDVFHLQRVVCSEFKAQIRLVEGPITPSSINRAPFDASRVPVFTGNTRTSRASGLDRNGIAVVRDGHRTVAP